MPVGKWLNGLIGGFIGGGAGAVTSTVTASMLAPEQFNAGAQWKSLLSIPGGPAVKEGIEALTTAASLPLNLIPA